MLGCGGEADIKCLRLDYLVDAFVGRHSQLDYLVNAGRLYQLVDYGRRVGGRRAGGGWILIRR